MSGTLIVGVGSTSEHKIDPTKMGLQALGITHFEVRGCKAKSRKNEQPEGQEETYEGAWNRANDTMIFCPDAKYVVGIESGLLVVHRPELSNLYLDFAMVVVIHVESKQSFFASSEGVQFPAQYVEEARRRGFDKVTTGQVIYENLGGDATDPYPKLTDGAVYRKDTLVRPIKSAFAQAFKALA